MKAIHLTACGNPVRQKTEWRTAPPSLRIRAIRLPIDMLIIDYGSEGCVFESRRVQCQRVRGSQFAVHRGQFITPLGRGNGPRRDAAASSLSNDY
jgi:hypothetical protein